MCYFITVAIASGLKSRFSAELPGQIRMDRQENRSIIKLLPEGRECCLITTGDIDHQCSCRLYVSRDEAEKEKTDPVPIRMNKYRRKGWSESKIERAIASARADAARQEREEFIGIRRDIRQVITRFVAAHTRAHVIVHWYDGSCDDEVVQSRTDSVSCKEFDSPRYCVPEDMLVEVR